MGIMTEAERQRYKERMHFKKEPMIPLSVIDEIKAQIIDEAEFAYADFEQYKVDVLGVDAEYVEDELPNDDFRYGLERAFEIINRKVKEYRDDRTAKKRNV